MAQRLIVIMTLRIGLTYEASQRLAAYHMLTSAKPILARSSNDARKTELLAKMNQF